MPDDSTHCPLYLDLLYTIDVGQLTVSREVPRIIYPIGRERPEHEIIDLI